MFSQRICSCLISFLFKEKRMSALILILRRKGALAFWTNSKKWTNGIEMSSQTSVKQRTPDHNTTKDTNGLKGWPPSPSKQHEQSSSSKGTLYCTNESRKNLDSFSLSITVRDIPNYMQDNVKIRKEVLKIDRRSSRSLEYAECGLLVLLLKNGK